MEQNQAPSNEGNQQSEGVVNNEGVQTGEITYANGKFKTASDMEKSYLELESSYSKKLGGFEGAPESYNVEGDTNATIDMLQTWGKENNLSQKGFDALLEKYGEMNKTAEEQKKMDHQKYQEAEMTKLGDNAQVRVTNATDWVKANLGEDGIDVLNNFGGAKGIEVVEKIMKLTKNQSPVDAPAQVSYDSDKLYDMRYAKNERGDRRMSIEPDYAAKVAKLEAEFIASGGKLRK